MRLIYFAPLLLLTGCFGNPERVLVPVYTKVQCPEMQKADPIDPLPVTFVLAKTDDGDQVLGLDGQRYSNLSINTAEIIRYIKQQNNTIGYYKECIIRHNDIVEEKEKAPK